MRGLDPDIGHSKKRGIKIQKELMEEYLKKKCNEVIADVEALLKQLDSYKDSGWVLDFCDTLNKLSVTY